MKKLLLIPLLLFIFSCNGWNAEIIETTEEGQQVISGKVTCKDYEDCIGAAKWLCGPEKNSVFPPEKTTIQIKKVYHSGDGACSPPSISVNTVYIFPFTCEIKQ